jgi:hypothetical protein
VSGGEVKAGAFMVCAYCGHLARLGEAGELLHMDDAARVELDADPELARAVKAAQRMVREKPAVSALVTDFPRKLWVVAVFGTDAVPILSPRPLRALLPKIGEREVYLVDLAAIDTVHRLRLVAYIAEKFGLDAGEVGDELDRVGMPLLAEGCMVVEREEVAHEQRNA